VTNVDPFARVDPSDDRWFYAVERKVTHIEDGAIEALRAFYGELLAPGARVLDLMSSWRSHLPHHGLGEVIGLGMNGPEMADNPQLHSHVVHDLNAAPSLPFDDESFDAAVCTVSVQYLTSPVEVFAEVRRVLGAGSARPFAVAFSNRCFPTKAVAIWRYGTDADHVDLVRTYFSSAGFDAVQAMRLPSPDDPVYVVTGSA
jgi:SAM-dependent methyltransferase